MKYLKRFNEKLEDKPKKLPKKVGKLIKKLDKSWTGSTPIEKKDKKDKKITEAIVDWETDNIQSFYDEAKNTLTNGFITFDRLKEIGDKYDIEVVDYDTFYKNLPDDKMRKDAPPKGGIPFFGLCNPVTYKATLVLQVPRIDSRGLNFAYHMLKHENVHVGQKSRKKDKSKGEYLGDIRNTKAYFSNKDEIMAFAQSVSDMVMDMNPQTLEQAVKMIDRSPLWRPIQSVDVETKKRYKKYIYLYLEKEFEKTGRGKEIPTSQFLINQKIKK